MGNDVTLTELEKVILNKVQNYINKNEKVGIDIIAKECFVSKATIVKLSKKLGYSGYSEMYYTILAANNNSSKLDFFNNSSDMCMNEHLKGDINILVEALREFKDKKIYLDSLGVCDSAREYYLQKLLIFGFDAASSYHYEAFKNNKSGLYLFFSYSGYRAEIIEKVNEAIRNNFKVIAFTASKDSPLAKISHVTLEIAGIKSDREHYLPNLFTANLIILLELALSEYSKRYLSEK
ncbi:MULTISPECIES: MurR/RpiR family transcriptional regulator [Clostridium]|uniref:MurR/RpiR family transcriptional regulator n=1 Tax=Clostridium cibarium TaxID=2762247 RepID=A0ABR8PWD2_9CLOT|nr:MULTISPECIES: MurR/RpiR family transcriptional regulator [Clostridium]MBD7912491.1 MurR/RpiR family transcriptional regulator [Clostridium cibarium]